LRSLAALLVALPLVLAAALAVLVLVVVVVVVATVAERSGVDLGFLLGGMT